MRHKFFYGSKPKFTDADKSMFSHGVFRYHRLLLTVDGKPVGITRHIDPRCVPLEGRSRHFRCCVQQLRGGNGILKG